MFYMATKKFGKDSFVKMKNNIKDWKICLKIKFKIFTQMTYYFLQDYKVEWDPQKNRSEKTGRGPLVECET
jgi:hypothetical protein